MGLQISDIVPKKEIDLRSLKNKVVCVDAFNTIYQFLSTVRQADGTPLMDKRGRITSHLSGLFYRNINLLCDGIRLVYVFDGKPPKLKAKTKEKRNRTREGAKEKYEEAKTSGNIENMGKYARQLSVITNEIISESKEMLKAMGIAVIQAPSEGESQAAFMAKSTKLVEGPGGFRARTYAVGSQDYDSLLFGAPILIQNLTLSQRRKTASGYVDVYPVMIELDKVLNSLQINIDQLICLGILAGTDYNPGGIKGIGPKKALQIVKQYKQPVLIFESVREQIDEMFREGMGFDWQEIFALFKNPEVDDNAEIVFPKIDEKKIEEILLNHDFSPERISKQFEKLDKAKEELQQRTLF